MWKRAAESGKSMKPLTDDAKRQVELYGEAWEEAAKQIELASKVEEFMNLDAAMQEEIEKVNARFADFETKTAESLDKVNAARKPVQIFRMPFLKRSKTLDCQWKF